MRDGVLFVQSATQPPLGADIWVHSLIMRYLDRERFHVHAACAPGATGAPTPAFAALSSIPELEIVPVNFGTERQAPGRSPARAVLEPLAAGLDFGRLAVYVRKHKIRLVHTSDRPRDALACVALAKLTGARSIIQVHTEYGNWMSRVLRSSMRSADALIGVSRFVSDSLITSGHRAAGIHSVLNAIEPSKWDPSLDGSAIREELGIPRRAQMLTCIARVYPNKGALQMIQALGKIKDEAPDAYFVVVGQDYPVGSGFTATLKAKAAELGIQDRVLFTGQRTDIARILAATDIYAMPSHREPFGLAYAEAMAMKKPIICLDVGGHLELIEPGKSGLASAEDDIAALAKDLLTLIRDPALREKMGAHGRAAIEARFTPERQARDIERVYASVLAAKD